MVYNKNVFLGYAKTLPQTFGLFMYDAPIFAEDENVIIKKSFSRD